MHLVKTGVDCCCDDLDLWEGAVDGEETTAGDEVGEEDDVGFWDGQGRFGEAEWTDEGRRDQGALELPSLHGTKLITV